MSTPEPRPAALPSWYDADDAPARLDVNTCIHCGLCLMACPTYRELKIEPDSPRGRIYLMRGLLEGRIEPSEAVVTHLDNCLDCRACETVCPAGVPYSRMLEATRGQIERRARRASPMRLLGSWVLRHVLPRPKRVALAADVLRLGQSGPIAAFMQSSLATRLLPRFATQGFAMTPPIAPRRERELERVESHLAEGARLERRADALVFHPAGTPKALVAFHVSCVMPAMFSSINHEVVRLLVLAGAQVTVPHAQTCCGALQAHAGLRHEAKALGRANAQAFAGPYDFIVSHSAGCGAALREMGHLLHDDANAQVAQEFSTRVRDVSEVLAHLGLPPAEHTLSSRTDAAKPLRVAYHDPCHLAHAQRVREAPRRLLRQLPGVELVDLANSDWCCGSAGIYNLSHPAMANAQLQHKLDSIEAVAPEVVIASNPGCLLHMQRGARERGAPVQMLHLVELLGEAHPSPRA
ncbi:MAG: heterodisulfide reductase-related iron-sulfur binding cluster [Candidatus Eisenbacteria bacterium]